MADRRMADRLAFAFHFEYERCAKRHGWDTQKVTQVAWDDLPAANRETMVATVAALLDLGFIAPGPQYSDPPGSAAPDKTDLGPEPCPHNPWSVEEQEGWFAALARTVAVDFDGVLHPYTAGWTGSVPADEPPTAGAIRFLQELTLAGYRVVVFSTRCELEEGLKGTKWWLEKYGLARFIDDVTCQKPAAVAYIDDRAVPFHGTWSGIREEVDRLAQARPHGAGHGSGSRREA